MQIAIKPLTHPLDVPRPALWIRITTHRRGLTRWGRSWILPLPAVLAAVLRHLGGRHIPAGGEGRPEGGPGTSLCCTTGSRSMDENPVGACLVLVAAVLLTWLVLVMAVPL